MRYFCCVFQLLQRRNRLYEASQLRRHLLEESYKFQTFQRDCDETKSWINEKLKTASDENYLVSAALRSHMTYLSLYFMHHYHFIQNEALTCTYDYEFR